MALSETDKTQFETELAELNAAISKAYNSMEYSTGGTTVKRQELDSLLKRRARVKKMLAGNRAKEII